MAQRKMGVNQDSIQEMNRSLLIRLLRENAPCSRASLAKMSGLKQATVTNIITYFIQWRLVKELSLMPGDRGRRSIGLAIDGGTYAVIGVRLSRKHFIVGMFDLTGRLSASVRVEIARGDSPRHIFENIKNSAAELIARQRKHVILAIGMALPGPFITQDEKIALMTESQGWNELSMKEEMEAKFKLPTFLEHDANAAVLAQLWHDKEVAKAECLAYIAAGQGIGAGIMYKGELLKGELGIAGEIGHTSIDFNGPACACGNRGCLEKYCSSIAFANRVNSVVNPPAPLTLSDISARIAAGDPVCIKEYSTACEALGFGMANLVYNFNPGVIVLGDEMAHVASPIMLDLVTNMVQRRVLPVLFANLEIKISRKVNNSALHGAAIVAISHVFSDPDAFIKR